VTYYYNKRGKYETVLFPIKDFSDHQSKAKYPKKSEPSDDEMSWSSSRHGQGQISTMLMKKPMLRVQSERKLNFSDYQVRIKPREFNF